MPHNFTRNGDDGTTGILGEGRVPKYDQRMEALGVIDEANAALGLARASGVSPVTGDVLVKVQRTLYEAMAEVAASPGNAERFRIVSPAHVQAIESDITSLESQVRMPSEFILPGDTPSSAALDLARTITRRAERRLAALNAAGQLEGSFLLAYFNRLSSLLFTLELFEIQAGGSSSPTLAKDKSL